MKKERELLFSVTKKDLVIEWFSGSGAGGQHRNKHPNCCRLKHLDSGVIVTGTEQRSREQNKKKAFSRLVKHPDFNKWLRLEASRKSRDINEIKRELDAWVDEQMQDKYLKIEYGVCDE